MKHYSDDRLVAIECDACGALIAPNPDIADSGWVKCGCDDPKQGGRFEYHYCPTHAHRVCRYG